MNNLGDLAEQLCHFFQSPWDEAVQAFADAQTLHRDVGGGQRIELHCQPQQQRWLLGVGCDTTALDERTQARLEEALLRAGYDSRWGLQLVGLSDETGVSLVDCDFPRSATQLTASVVESHCHSLLAQLNGLVCGEPSEWNDQAASAEFLRLDALAPTCACACAFSEQMQALDASRSPASIAPQELLLDDDLPLRISLHPHSHHWVIEAFAWNLALLDDFLRRSLVDASLLINGLALAGRQIICSLDGGDRLVLISRWHLDHAAGSSLLVWLDYTAQQARRMRAAAAAIAMHAGSDYGTDQL